MAQTLPMLVTFVLRKVALGQGLVHQSTTLHIDTSLRLRIQFLRDFIPTAREAVM